MVWRIILFLWLTLGLAFADLPRYSTSSLELLSGNSTRAFFTYQLGPTGNRTGCSESVNGVSRNYVWTYDLLYRLTGENVFGGQSGGAVYGYDAVGNRTSRQAPAGVIF